jgi:hypothetical protein
MILEAAHRFQLNAFPGRMILRMGVVRRFPAGKVGLILEAIAGMLAALSLPS